MKKSVSITLASFLVVAPIGGFAYSQDTSGGDTGRDTVTENGKTVTTDGSDPTGQTTESSSSGVNNAATMSNVEVIQLSTLEADKSASSEAETLKLKANDPITMKKVQDELATDQGLVEALAAKNVQIQNVIDVQTSATGGKIVYVK
ncbi:hypothetical protein J2Y63_006430 [Shinella sp. BE166]|uniref:hypothetical protein n=1 Tax=Shinella sp. BE166 TaxID=3373918 RepID=UPI003EC09A96